MYFKLCIWCVCVLHSCAVKTDLRTAILLRSVLSGVAHDIVVCVCMCRGVRGVGGVGGGRPLRGSWRAATRLWRAATRLEAGRYAAMAGGPLRGTSSRCRYAAQVYHTRPKLFYEAQHGALTVCVSRICCVWLTPHAGPLLVLAVDLQRSPPDQAFGPASLATRLELKWLAYQVVDPPTWQHARLCPQEDRPFGRHHEEARWGSRRHRGTTFFTTPELDKRRSVGDGSTEPRKTRGERHDWR